jgi:hypothetical protein
LQEERKQAEREAFGLWSKRWDERNIALHSPRASLVTPSASNSVTATSTTTTSEAQAVRERTENESERASGDGRGDRQDSSARFHFMFDELAPVSEEELKRERRDKRARKARREWAKEVEAAEQRMEQGQSAVANSFKRRREQFYERRRSISDLSSDEHNVVNTGLSFDVQCHISLAVTLPDGTTSPQACHSQTSTSVALDTKANASPSSSADRTVIAGAMETTKTKTKTTSGDNEKHMEEKDDNGNKKQEKKLRKGSFRLPSFRRSNRQTPGDARPASADTSTTKSRVGAGDKSSNPRVGLRRVLSSDLTCAAAN